MFTASLISPYLTIPALAFFQVTQQLTQCTFAIDVSEIPLDGSYTLTIDEETFTGSGVFTNLYSAGVTQAEFFPGPLGTYDTRQYRARLTKGAFIGPYSFQNGSAPIIPPVLAPTNVIAPGPGNQFIVTYTNPNSYGLQAIVQGYNQFGDPDGPPQIVGANPGSNSIGVDIDDSGVCITFNAAGYTSSTTCAGNT